MTALLSFSDLDKSVNSPLQDALPGATFQRPQPQRSFWVSIRAGAFSISNRIERLKPLQDGRPTEINARMRLSAIGRPVEVDDLSV